FEIECRQSELARNLRVARQPFESSGDHQMNDDEEIVIDCEDDSFSGAANFAHDFAGHIGNCWLDCAQHEWIRKSHASQYLSTDASADRFDVDGHIREFRHAV